MNGAEETGPLAVLPPGRRTWAVASVRGMCDRLIALHDALAQRIAIEDNIVYLGNFLGHGRDIAGTVNELLVFRRALMARQVDGDGGAIIHLRGSQEEMWHKLLQVQFAPNPRQVLEWMLGQGVDATLAAYGGDIEAGRSAANRGAFALSRWTNNLRATVRSADGHDQLLSALKRAAFTADRTLLFVNAGIDPGRPLEGQNDIFWWGGQNFDSIETPYDGFTRVVRGADWRNRGVVVNDVIVSIDGGCGFGGPLVAACFDPAANVIELLEA